MAVALAGGASLVAAAVETPAHAQKKKKDENAAQKGDYSPGFIAAYTPLKAMQDAPDADVAALAAAAPGLVAAAQTPDDRMVAGSTIYGIGTKAQKPDLQRQGLRLMLESGKVPAENLGQYNFIAGQLAYNAREFDAARTYFTAAMDAGYTDSDPRALMAESYFSQNRFAEGFDLLDQAIEARRAANLPVSEDWIKRGLSIAYNNKIGETAHRYAYWYVRDYPDAESWGDAIAVALNIGGYQAAETLDLLRLARRTSTVRTPEMYLEYIEAADPRRLPGEVVAVVDEGWKSGVLPRDDRFAVESRSQASGRLEADRADLPTVAREARAGGASLATVLAAGDAYLSYDRPAEAEEFYTKALSLPGANRNLLLTRMGIAQVHQGKFNEAQASFDKVDGDRQPIARLWSAYAAQQAS